MQVKTTNLLAHNSIDEEGGVGVGDVSGHVADDDAWRHEGPLAEI